MSTAIVSASVCTDADTGSYLELATRAGRACLARAGVGPDRIGIVINAGVFRDSNICEPAVAALIQQRLEIGLDYRSGQVPAFSFDIMSGATGVLHALTAAHCLLAPGALEYALILAGDAHPSTERTVADFPYTATGSALLLRSCPGAGGFGRPYTTETAGAVEPSGWLDLGAAGSRGRSVISVRSGMGDPVTAAAAVARKCLAAEGMDRTDIADGTAVLLAPAPIPGFTKLLAERLDVPATAVDGVDPAVGDPYTAAPVHAYLAAADTGRLDNARVVVFLAADDSSAAAVAYRSQPVTPVDLVADLHVERIGM
ncbi:hypothetical protein [Nocardia brasiliensis]|uniref:hypothetical protein n=1 Tax=Nocardia brasiliensis TaxID=37326 RepID=UPI003671AFB4